MLRPRIIPALLLKGDGLVKGIGFKNHTYVGDPMNAVQIFNKHQVDEIAFIDISATREKRTPSIDLVERLSDLCQIPFAVGGGINSVEAARRLIQAGAEKVVIGSAFFSRPELVREIANEFGSQAVVVSVDYAKGWFGFSTFSHSGTEKQSLSPEKAAALAVENGAGEILLNSIDRDGTRQGYDLEMIKKISSLVNVPVIALGGCGSLADLQSGLESGASAVSAGSFFVHHGPRRAVLISFPTEAEIKTVTT